MRHRSPIPSTDADSDWTYSETIDEATSAIEVRGRVDRLGVDLLRGTIEELSRRGHRDITVTMEHPDDVSVCARGVLAEVAARLAACQGALTIRWIAAESGNAGIPFEAPRPHHMPEQGRGTVRRRMSAERRPIDERPRRATGGRGFS
jgi:hypothetical protein